MSSHNVPASFSQAVESLRVVAQNFFLHRVRQVVALAKYFDCIDITRRIGVAVVGADDQAIFAAFGPEYEPLVQGAAALGVVWLILFWMYRRKLFIKI